MCFPLCGDEHTDRGTRELLSGTCAVSFHPNSATRRAASSLESPVSGVSFAAEGSIVNQQSHFICRISMRRRTRGYSGTQRQILGCEPAHHSVSLSLANRNEKWVKSSMTITDRGSMARAGPHVTVKSDDLCPLSRSYAPLSPFTSFAGL